MKKSFLGIIIILLALTVNFSVYAGEKHLPKEQVVEIYPLNKADSQLTLHQPLPRRQLFFFDWYRYERNHAFGVKVGVTPDYYATFNFEYEESNHDSLLSLGAIYRIPQRFILWHFYLGGEYTYSTRELQGDPYILFGTDFLFFFFESKLPVISEKNPVYRTGFRFSF